MIFVFSIKLEVPDFKREEQAMPLHQSFISQSLLYF